MLQKNLGELCMNIFKILTRIFLALVLFLMLTGCTSIKLEMIRQIPQQSPANTGLLAGAAKADITPPPGMPLAGYSLMANYSKGFRTRLYARVLYLKSAAGRGVALVQCDFLTGSLLLNHRVAELVATETDIGIDGLLIAGTHTHSGPGGFFDTNFYNDFAANSSGFDPEYFDYLSKQIANAVIRAFKEKRPAKIATGEMQVWQMTRNRSIKSYYANKNIVPKTPPDVYDAVNPDLHLIRVDVQDKNGQYYPLAAFSSFSIHGTTLPAQNNLYNGDVFAYIEREVEYGIKDNYKTSWEPVHVAFNGTHGDNSPNYNKQNFAESRRLGTSIGQKALELFRSLDGKLKDQATINFAAREIDLYSEPCIDGTCVCDRPVVGSALSSGADDGATPILSQLPWFRQGSARWYFTNFCQGHKRTLGGPGQYLVLPKKDFPHQLFLQTIQIDDFLLIPLPFETTTESGVRIAAECKGKVASQNKNDIRTFFVISCANGYYGYVTTPEEYRIQRYEGGHTLYGPQTQSFLAKQAGKLAQELGRDKIENNFPAKWSYKLKAKRFYTSKVKSGTERKAYSYPAFASAVTGDEPYWSFVWEDLPPHLISWGKTLVTIEESENGFTWKQVLSNGRPLDDSGYDIAVILKEVINKGKTGIYETRWYNPQIVKLADDKIKYYRFVILSQAGRDPLYSLPFHLI
jgi:neutral ceramidase